MFPQYRSVIFLGSLLPLPSLPVIPGMGGGGPILYRVKLGCIAHRAISWIFDIELYNIEIMQKLCKINILWKECPVENHMKCMILDLNLYLIDDKEFTYLCYKVPYNYPNMYLIYLYLG